MRKKRFLFPVFLAAVLFLTAVSPAVGVYAVGEEDEEGTEEYVEETPEALYWTIETNEIKKWPQGPQVEAEGASVMDMDTGAFLYAKNMEAKMYPASITKVMTTLVAIEHLDPENLDKKIKASEEALAPIGPDSSQIWLSPGEKITLRSALYAIMLASGNDASNVVAETIGGSIENFVQMMNDKAAELGCVNTHFVNPHGLHDENHYTCAHDMALIAQAAYEKPLFRQITKTVEYKIPKTKIFKEDRWLLNHQKMLYEDDEYTYEPCTGGKTGFTDDAWNTLVTFAEKDGKKLVCIELRVNGAWKTFQESAALLDYGFDHFRHEEIDTEIANCTLGQLAGVCRFGKAAKLNTEQMNKPAVSGSSTVMVTLPEGVKTGKVQQVMENGSQILCRYRDWKVGGTRLTFFNPAIEVEEPQAPETEAAEVFAQSGENGDGSAGEADGSEAGLRENTGFDQKVDGYMDNLTLGMMNIWHTFDQWVGAHEVASAVIGFILILLLIPLLVIAYIRDKSARATQKERKLEEEERKKIEESIENKSVQEIEAEIRAELEKERLAKEKEEARRRAAEEEERKMAEMEAIIERQSQKKEQENIKKEDSEKENSENKKREEAEKEEIEKEEERHELGSTDQG